MKTTKTESPKNAKPVLSAAEKEKRRVAGIAKQRTSLKATMALTDPEWYRALVCVNGKHKGQAIKNPRRGWFEVKWFSRNQKTRMAKALFDAAKKGEYPTYKLDGNEYQLAMGLTKAARAKLKLVGEW